MGSLCLQVYNPPCVPPTHFQPLEDKQQRKMSSIPHSRTFSSADAHGGETVNPSKLTLVLIEYQNEFTTEGGKLHDGVKPVMEENGMLQKNRGSCRCRACCGRESAALPDLL